MNEIEKAELNKQKKLVDCANHLNGILATFTQFEADKAELLSTIDGFDLTHSDTYLELTQNVRRDLLWIGLYAQNAMADLAKYRQLCHPKSNTYSIRERKIRAECNSTATDNLKPVGLDNREEEKKVEKKTEGRFLRLEWAVWLLFCLQMVILLTQLPIAKL